MSNAQGPRVAVYAVEPVFMDRSGRRRRLVTALGAALGVLVIAGGALLIAGLLGSSPVPLPGLPDNGQGMIQRGNNDGAGLQPAATPADRAGASAHPRATTGATGAGGATTPAGAPATTDMTTRPGNRPTSHPGNPKPSRTK